MEVSRSCCRCKCVADCAIMACDIIVVGSSFICMDAITLFPFCVMLGIHKKEFAFTIIMNDLSQRVKGGTKNA